MHIKTTHTAKIGATWEAAALRGTLCAADNVVLVAHMNADGDAVGSVTGAYSLLALHTGKTPTPLLPDGCPEDYLWLPNTDLILSGKDNPDQCADAIAKADLIICMDLNQMERTGRLANQLKAASAKKILIDHHENPAQDAFDIIVSDPDISSTCELAFWLFRDLFGPQPFPADAATSLFTGMCTDTGTFAYSNRDASLYLAAAELSQCGIDPMDINRRIKNTFTPNRLRFFGHAMSQLLTVYPDRQVALLPLRESDMAAYGVESHELTGLVNEVMKLRDTDCAVLIREEGDHVRLSLRSKQRYDVNLLAHELFGGGGHQRAAGATSTLPFADTVKKVKHKLGLAMLAAACAITFSACRDVPVVEQQAYRGDTLKESLIDANRHIARSEEVQIDNYIARRQWTMQRLPSGVRVMRTEAGSGGAVDYEDTVAITYRLEALSGQVVYSHVADTVVAGKLQPTRGLDAALRTLHRGDRATVIVPSEQAYGVLGDGNRVSSRMVLIYDIKINQ